MARTPHRMFELTIALVLLLGLGAFLIAREEGKHWRLEASLERLSDAASAAGLVGRRLGNHQLTDLAGKPVALHDLLSPRAPTLLMILDVETCLSCGEYGIELRILRREWPRLRQVVVGVGEDTALLARYLRTLPSTRLLDPTGQMPRALKTSHTPIIALLDGRGTALLVDTRSAVQSKSYPLSKSMLFLRRALADVDQLAAPAGSTSPSVLSRPSSSNPNNGR